MTTVDSATKILDTMLGHLGFTATIELQETHDGPCLQIHSGDSKILIGKDGDRLDDLQYLVNRILRRHQPKAKRIKVDCNHFRSIQEDQLRTEVEALADRVKSSGNPLQMRPLNAYYRRMAYNILAEDPLIVSHSPQGDERLKQITISIKSPSDAS
jgi:spoIIIJ-associated protein